MTSFYYYDQNPSDIAFQCKLGLCYLNLAGIAKFKYEKKNEEDSGRSSKMTPSYKWPIEITVITEANKDQSPWGIFSTS